MQINWNSGILRRGIAVSTLAAAVTVSSASVAGTTVLFEQPSESGITNNIFVAYVTKAGMPKGKWDMIAFQPDPYTNGYLVPTSWDAGSKTGFTPSSPSTAQQGFRNQTGTSTAQMEGGTVGAYLNSKDLKSSNGDLFMMAPQYRFQNGAMPVPFASSTTVLNGELDLQVPVASGKKTYINADYAFVAPNGQGFTYQVTFILCDSVHPVPSPRYDSRENIYMLDIPLLTNTEFLTKASTSSSFSDTPWLGMRHFQWTIDYAQFTAALKYMAQNYPGKITYMNPADYSLASVHLNAEFNYAEGPAELGWSMQNWKVWESW